LENHKKKCTVLSIAKWLNDSALLLSCHRKDERKLFFGTRFCITHRSLLMHACTHAYEHIYIQK